MSPAQLSEVERGLQPLSLRRANQISKVLGSSFAEVVQAVLQDRVEAAGFCELQVSVALNVVETVIINGHSHEADKLP